MDVRAFPGGPSQAVVVPSKALREVNAFGQTAVEQLMTDLATASGATRAYATSSTVAAQTTPDMTVKVSPFAVYGGSPLMHGLGLSPNCTGQTNVAVTGDGLSATCNVTVTAANGSNPRRDLIVFQIQEIDMDYSANTVTTVSLAAVNPSDGTSQVPAEFYPNTVQRVALKYVAGTPAATPALPVVPAGWTPLAEIYVGTSVTSITNSNIFFALPEANRGYSLNDNGDWRRQGYAYTSASGLTLNVKGGSYILGTTSFSLADSTLTLTNSATNYIYINSSGVLTADTVGFASGSIPLATAVTSGGNITSISDKRAWLRNGGATSSSSSVSGFMFEGLVPDYTSVNSVTINKGICRDDTNSVDISVASPIVVSISSSGANGLDTGVEANSTWYWLWLIMHTNGTVSGLLSVSKTSPTLPTGYVYKRRLPIAIKNDSSGNFIPYYISAGFAENRPKISWNVRFADVNLLAGQTQALYTLSPTHSPSWTTIDLSAFVPPGARTTGLYISSGDDIVVAVREVGTTNSKTIGQGQNTAGPQHGGRTEIRCDSSQHIEYQIAPEASHTPFVAVEVEYFILES